MAALVGIFSGGSEIDFTELYENIQFLFADT